MNDLLGVGGEFSQSIRDADVNRLKQFFDTGVDLGDLQRTSEDGFLAQCVRGGEVQIAQLFLLYGADLEQKGREGYTPLQMAIAKRNPEMVRVLLEAGADSNSRFSRPVSEEFLDLTQKESMRWFLKHERHLTPLMMAVNNGDLTIIKLLLDHGAKKYARSGRYQLYPLSFASRRGDVKAMQMMLGKDPAKEKFYIVLDLSDQRLRLYDLNKNILFSSRVSSGKAGYRTPTGEYVITDKHRHHRSTIYHVKMPYFQRLSSGAFGFHAGYVPSYPASHGCIRMPYQSAKELFKITPTGTRVLIQD